MVTPEPPRPNCYGLHELMESTRADVHQSARTLCVDCPAFTACEDTVRDILAGDWRSGLHGTWAGRLYDPEGARRRAVRR